jgi:hypothetical protein
MTYGVVRAFQVIVNLNSQALKRLRESAILSGVPELKRSTWARLAKILVELSGIHKDVRHTLIVLHSWVLDLAVKLLLPAALGGSLRLPTVRAG